MNKRIGIAFWALALLAAPVGGANAQGCLGPDERRSAIAGGDAVPLRVAAESVRRQVAGRLVSADLCRDGGNLVYRLSFLEAPGALRFALVEARSGRVLSVR